MPSRVGGSLELKGPFFKGDPKLKWRRNIRKLMIRVSDVGRDDVRAQLRQGEGERAPIRGLERDRVSQYVRGRASSMAGRPWQVSAVVSIDTRGLSRKQAIAVKAAAAEIERRRHVFRRTANRMRKVRRMLEQGLLEGLA